MRLRPPEGGISRRYAPPRGTFPRHRDTPHPVGLLLDGLVFLRPKVARLRLRRCSGLRKRSPISLGRKSSGWVALAEVPSSLVWDLAAYRRSARGWFSSPVTPVRSAELPIHLFAVGFRKRLDGRPRRCRIARCGDEGLSEVTGSSISPAAAMMLRAVQGREAGVLEGWLEQLELAAGGDKRRAACHRLTSPSQFCTTASPATRRQPRRREKPPLQDSTLDDVAAPRARRGGCSNGRPSARPRCASGGW